MAAEILSSNQALPATYESQRKNWFIFNIEGIDAFLLKSAAKPTFSHDPIERHWLDTTIYFSGKRKVSTISVVLQQAIAPNANHQVMEWLRTQYDSVTGYSGYADYYKRTGQVKSLDPMKVVIEYWLLRGMLITEANFGELAYDSGDLAETSMTIQPDDAVLIK